MNETIACVACAEQIRASAKLCKHCGTLQDDPRFAHENQPDAAQRQSGSWQFLPKVEQDRRMQILDYLTSSGQDFFDRYCAYEYLFVNGMIDARESQMGRMESIGESWSDGADLARSPDLTAKEAEKFANANVGTVRMNLARNLLTPPAVLAKLARDQDINVRIGVLVNPSTPVDSLVQVMNEVGLLHVNLALSPDFISDGLQNATLGSLRFYLLGNWNVDFTDIAFYWGNEDKNRLLVAEHLARNTMLPPQFFGPILDYISDELSKDGLSTKRWKQSFEVLANLVSNPGLPDKLFKKIKTDVPGLFREFGHLKDRPRVNW